MGKAEFLIEVVTPLFMAGANQSGPPELRAASLKGLLRFWYRAIYPNDVAGEQELFGAMGARSAVGLVVTPVRPIIGQARSPDLSNFNYLGYGLINHDKPSKKFLTVRPYFQPGSTFALTLTFSPRLSAAAKEKVLRAFYALAMLGGLGARSRRGFGAFAITSLAANTSLNFQPADVEMFREDLKAFLNTLNKETSAATYSCFSTKSRVLVGPPKGDGMQVLGRLNALLQKNRSYYEVFPHTPKTSGIPKDDHDLISISLPTPLSLPLRRRSGPSSACRTIIFSGQVRKKAPLISWKEPTKVGGPAPSSSMCRNWPMARLVP